MKKLKGFTLIELLVVISIIAMLLAILMPSLQQVKKQAQAVVCRSNLKQFGVMSALYSNDYNNRLTPGNAGPISVGLWPNEYGPYHEGAEEIRLCPSAKKGYPNPTQNQHFFGSTFRAASWGQASPRWGDNWDWIDYAGWYSYGMNSYSCSGAEEDPSRPGSGITRENLEVIEYWGTSSARGAYNVPLMGDCAWITASGDDIHPMYGAQFIQPAAVEDVLMLNWGLELYALDRHVKSMNMVFLDGSARKVDLKEVWTLDWHRNFNRSNVWTKAGGATKAQWEGAAPWMVKYKDY